MELEFLTERLRLPVDRLGVTCFAGDADAAADRDSVSRWSSLGMTRIALLGRDDNWWGPAGAIVRLPLGNVDTGMGVERALVALNGLGSVYEVDTIRPLHDALGGHRILTDHLRAACAIVEDGVRPSNKDRGYVLRRLLRRAMVHARRAGLPREWYRVAATGETGDVIADELGRFETTLARGLRELERRPVVDGEAAFDLFQTYGFPFELTRELATSVDEVGFREALARHRDRSRAHAGSFVGGLADHSDAIIRYHTLTHLLQAALRSVLGDHVIQRGSNITRERLRFDFSHSGRLAPDQLTRVESMVNAWVARDLVVERATLPLAEARAQGAIGAFGEKYGDVVSVYTIREGDTVISREMCGGPHVASSRDILGAFRIVREEPVAAGIRRIKAVFEPR
jgi:alanyl-tRNA synthetase